MYIRSFSVKNIKCFEDASLAFSGASENQAGWHVLLGINGTGKSTMLQAMALAMLGPVSGGRLLQQPASWVRSGTSYGEIQAGLTMTAHDSTGKGAPRKKSYDAHLLVTGADTVTVEGREYTLPQVTLFKPAQAKSLNAGPYSNRRGWFSAGYGPFRRLTGSGGEEDPSKQYGQGREARHHTLFSESAALTRCEKWLVSMHSQSIDPAVPNAEFLQGRLEIAREIIDDLLPHGVKIATLNSQGVTFSTRAGVTVALSQLSDGYRSFLALAIDLLRHILESNELWTMTGKAAGQPSINTEGVVLIDEADTHLHPSWQREIGFRMCKTFPNIQFIVSSHSPFVAQAAKEGGLFLVNGGEDGKVSVVPAAESVRGWRADQVLLSPLFGLHSTRDPETQGFLERQAELAARRHELSAAEKKELRALDEILHHRLTAPGDTFEERAREQKMQAFIDRQLAEIDREDAT